MDDDLTTSDEAYFALLKSAPPGPQQWRTSTGSTLALGRRLRRRRHLAGGAGGAALALVAVFATVSLAAGPGGPTTVVTDPADASAGVACRVPAGGPAPAWLGKPAAETVLDRLRAALYKRFGAESAALTAGLIGQATDHVTQQVVVVVDGATVDRSELQKILRTRVGGMPGAGQDWLEVRPGCHAAADLLKAERFIDGRTWMRGNVGYHLDLDARTSTFRMTIPAGPAADELRERLGELVSFDHSQVVDGTAGESLDTRYDACVRSRGFDPGGVQVLVWEGPPSDPPGLVPDPQPGKPWWVKTGRDVPADIHRPCMVQIGGADPNASSYGTASTTSGKNP